MNRKQYNDIENISVSHQLTTEERNLWDILLSNASKDFYSKEVHTISVSELIGSWSPGAASYQLLQALRRISLTIKYTVLNSQLKRETGVFPLLTFAQISDGTCYYSYSSFFKNHLYQYPSIYQCLKNLQLFNQLENIEAAISCSKISLAI